MRAARRHKQDAAGEDTCGEVLADGMKPVSFPDDDKFIEIVVAMKDVVSGTVLRLEDKAGHLGEGSQILEDHTRFWRDAGGHVIFHFRVLVERLKG